MRLQTFRIRYCFGFVDSGEINLGEPNNLVWVLGRTSSDKSSVLRVLEQLALGKRPDSIPGSPTSTRRPATSTASWKPSSLLRSASCPSVR